MLTGKFSGTAEERALACREIVNPEQVPQNLETIMPLDEHSIQFVAKPKEQVSNNPILRGQAEKVIAQAREILGTN